MLWKGVRELIYRKKESGEKTFRKRVTRGPKEAEKPI